VRAWFDQTMVEQCFDHQQAWERLGKGCKGQQHAGRCRGVQRQHTSLLPAARKQQLQQGQFAVLLYLSVSGGRQATCVL
jgi:hypothetical protein